MNYKPLLDAFIELTVNAMPWAAVVVGVAVLLVIAIRNLPKLQKIVDSLHPAFTDGCLLVVSTFLTGALTGLAQEEAYKYVNPVVLFWLKLGIGCTSGSLQSLVAYRNQQYAKHQTQLAANAAAQTTEPTTK